MNTLECQTDLRRKVVRDHEGWNGLDYIEVDSLQTTLTVVFLGKVPTEITKRNFAIEGGRTGKDRVAVVSIFIPPPQADSSGDQVQIHVDKPGDYSTYTLRLVGLDKIDVRYAALDFSFKAGCPSDLDCASSCLCEPEVFDKPVIDYLAKDYGSLRQLILDRLSLICPDWTERHIPDLGITLVELFAYTGDYLSYYQDAVATEAYIATARRRPSVRRHARLVNYKLSEGCNARALVAIVAANNTHFKAGDVRLITGVNQLIPIGTRAALQAQEIEGIPPSAYEVFEVVDWNSEVYVWTGNNELHIYTWGNHECCIEKGATSATLYGQLAGPESAANDTNVHLKSGDFLIFEEVLGAVTGQAVDADSSHRQAVRLTSVTQSSDALLNQPIIEIKWREEDALTFDLCISAIGAAPACTFLENISIARGNVILVDHGSHTGPEDLGSVPIKTSTQCCECEGQTSDVTTLPGRYRPTLLSAPLTFAAPVRASSSATEILRPDPRAALPVITLNSDGYPWTPRYDLLASSGSDRQFVVEIEEDGRANIRFGDGTLGRGPTAGSTFSALYRVGNGTAGNVGAGAISLLVHNTSQLSSDITRVWNPLPAQGGTNPEPMAEAKLNAPYAFRFGPQALQRAITGDDYAAIAERNPKIQLAAGRLVWIGSWYEAEISLDVKTAYASHSASIAAAIDFYLERYRHIGEDLDVRIGKFVSIDLALKVCILPNYLQAHVKKALLDAFSNRVLKGGALGFFHPDRLTFGQGIYLSAIIAVAQAIPGVASVRVARLQRQYESPNHEIENGLLPIGHFEIARLDNDPNYPGHGRLAIDIKGGR